MQFNRKTLASVLSQSARVFFVLFYRLFLMMIWQLSIVSKAA